MKFTHDYIKDVDKTIVQFLSNKNEYSVFSIDVDGGFKKPPVLETCRAMNNGMSFDDQVTLARHAIVGKNIKIYLDDKEVGNIIMSDVNDSFDTQQVFVDYPMALQVVIDTAVAFVSKNFMPPSKNIPAGATIQG